MDERTVTPTELPKKKFAVEPTPRGRARQRCSATSDGWGTTHRRRRRRTRPSKTIEITIAVSAAARVRGRETGGRTNSAQHSTNQWACLCRTRSQELSTVNDLGWTSERWTRCCGRDMLGDAHWGRRCLVRMEEERTKDGMGWGAGIQEPFVARICVGWGEGDGFGVFARAGAPSPSSGPAAGRAQVSRVWVRSDNC